MDKKRVPVAIKPAAGPAGTIVLGGVVTAAELAGEASGLIGGLLIGFGMWWVWLALLTARGVREKFPWLSDWMPFVGTLAPRVSFATPEEVPGPYVCDRVIRLAGLAHLNRVRNRVFERCHIYGPAVIVPGDSSIMLDGGTIDGDASQVFLPYPEDTPTITGVLVLLRCQFKDCTFTGVSILGTADWAQMMRREYAAHDRLPSLTEQSVPRTPASRSS